MAVDFLVVGAGMAGASAGYFLAESGRVRLLEMENAPGYHSTGRSAALFSEYYGGPVVRALTAASRAFFTDPPPEFSTPLVSPRGVLALAPAGAGPRFDAVLATGLTAPVPVREVSQAEATRLCPALRPDWFGRAMVKPAAMDIDVAALHHGFLAGLRARGGQVTTRARVRRLTRRGGVWHALTDAGEFQAPIVVNAAGAWADEVAALADVAPAGLTPLRRTAVLVDAPPARPGERPARQWPMVTDVTDTFYFRPESGGLLLSPADETPVPPGDARPDDLDVALAAERVQAATTLPIAHVRRAWAGLRSRVPDDVPVIGPAPDATGFFWLAALSGYGIQTAPAAGRLAAALAAGIEPADGGVPPGAGLFELAPGRSLAAHWPAA